MASNSQIAFAPLGQTVVIPAAASASTGVQALVDSRFDGKLVYLIKYGYWLLRYGYKMNPYEVEARAAEQP